LIEKKIINRKTGLAMPKAGYNYFSYENIILTKNSVRPFRYNTKPRLNDQAGL